MRSDDPSASVTRMPDINLAPSLRPHLQNAEMEMFAGFACCSANYVEFGSGGSTVLACHTVADTVTSIDSSQEWQARVAEECRHSEARVSPTLIHVDIGPTKE